MKRYYIDYSLSNGLGNPSISLYLTGCDKLNPCKNCHNWELQNVKSDIINLDKLKVELDTWIGNFKEFHKEVYVSVLGGEPLAPWNREVTYEISKYIKIKYPESKIVIYTWRDITQLEDYSMEYFDFGVFGEFEEDLYVKNTLPSSLNQYIYDFNNNEILKPIILKGERIKNGEI